MFFMSCKLTRIGTVKGSKGAQSSIVEDPSWNQQHPIKGFNWSKGDEGDSELGAGKSNIDSERTPGAEGPRPPNDEGELAHHDAVEIEIASS
jgi:hypothetical protein